MIGSSGKYVLVLVLGLVLESNAMTQSTFDHERPAFTVSVWEATIEYEYEYRDAEYEYEYEGNPTCRNLSNQVVHRSGRSGRRPMARSLVPAR